MFLTIQFDFTWQWRISSQYRNTDKRSRASQNFFEFQLNSSEWFQSLQLNPSINALTWILCYSIEFITSVQLVPPPPFQYQYKVKRSRLSSPFQFEKWSCWTRFKHICWNRISRRIIKYAVHDTLYQIRQGWYQCRSRSRALLLNKILLLKINENDPS